MMKPKFAHFIEVFNGFLRQVIDIHARDQGMVIYPGHIFQQFGIFHGPLQVGSQAQGPVVLDQVAVALVVQLADHILHKIGTARKGIGDNLHHLSDFNDDLIEQRRNRAVENG